MSLLTEKEMKMFRAKYSTMSNESLNDVVDTLKDVAEDFQIIATNARLKKSIAETILRERKRG